MFSQLFTDPPPIHHVARGRVVLATLLALAFAPRSASASDEPQVDRATTTDAPVNREIDRTSLYGDDARVPLPMTVVATSSFRTRTSAPIRPKSRALIQRQASAATARRDKHGLVTHRSLATPRSPAGK